MIIEDRIYEKAEILEPVILELLKSPSLCRLKDVNQQGYSHPFYLKDGFSRFEHSLGVFILLKRFKASLSEQIAGLIHDVSHSVFSHCIDYVLEEGSGANHSLQDDIFKEFVFKTEIPKIIKNYDLDLDYILDEHNFPLLEKLLPDLCADRIDYLLREAISYKVTPSSDIREILENLSTKDNFWYFKDWKIGKKFAELFFIINKKYFASITTAAMFAAVGDALKYALKNNYLLKDDLYTTDSRILNKLTKKRAGDEKFNLLMLRMEGKIKYENNPQDYTTHVVCKSRIVDPLVSDKNSIKKLSGIWKKWGDIVRQESKPKEYFIKFKQ